MRIGQAGIPAAMHARAEVHQPARSLDQAGQQVRGEHVDREDVLQTVIGADAPRLPVTDPGIVNDRIVRAAALACSATCRMPAMLDRSPTTTALAAGRAACASSALAALRACSVTECPPSASSLAAISPRPSVEPVMSTRDISNSLRVEAQPQDWQREPGRGCESAADITTVIDGPLSRGRAPKVPGPRDPAARNAVPKNNSVQDRSDSSSCMAARIASHGRRIEPLIYGGERPHSCGAELR